MRSVLCLGLLMGLPVTAALCANDPGIEYSPPQRDYILGCGGCHGVAGVSNTQLVPRLQGLVGYYLYLPEGRAYLSRLPNVAFSTMSDQRLAAVLNFLVFDVGGRSVPPGARRYDAKEVGALRKQPLVEVPLYQYRREIVDALILRYGASVDLRAYGEDMYGDRTGH